MASESDGVIRVVVVDGEAQTLASVRAKLLKHKRIRVIATGRNGLEALQLVNKHQPDVLILDDGVPVLNAVDVAARVAATVPATATVILARELEPEAIRQALRAGVKEYLEKGLDLKGLPEAILQVAARHTRSIAATPMASLWAFHSPKGTAGTTTLAVNAACELASVGRTLLLDLDALGGDSGFSLGLKVPRADRTLLGRLDAEEKIDSEFLKSVTRVFTLPARKGRGAKDPITLDVMDSPNCDVAFRGQAHQKFEAILELLQRQYSYIVVDLPSGDLLDRRLIQALVYHALDYSEHVFVPTNSDGSSTKSVLKFLRALIESNVSLGKVSLLFNRIVSDPSLDPLNYVKGKEGQQVRACLAIPTDPAGCAAASKKGLPVILGAPDSELARFIRALVHQTLNLPPPGGETSDVWGRIKEWLGR